MIHGQGGISKDLYHIIEAEDGEKARRLAEKLAECDKLILATDPALHDIFGTGETRAEVVAVDQDPRNVCKKAEEHQIDYQDCCDILC